MRTVIAETCHRVIDLGNGVMFPVSNEQESQLAHETSWNNSYPKK
jgi:hypothetical protein